MNILLVCACGASTSIVVEAMKESLSEDEKNYFIEAKSVQEIRDCIGKYDVILIAPQIRYQKKRIEKLAEPYDIVIEDIDPSTYGTCNGKKIMDVLRKLKK
ncbi:PTS sugar transporter subunit IIB [Anaerorhabdus sp.]|uniref:PTS sugar transporter subunit IIB n=1 Tax=Anaerorhabdus sp. TaxID=1872524 RepID=UPI002FCA6394